MHLCVVLFLEQLFLYKDVSCETSHRKFVLKMILVFFRNLV